MQYKKLRKSVKRRQDQVVSASQGVGENIDKYLLGRLERLGSVRRFISVWMIFWLILAVITAWQVTRLSSYFQTVRPVPGGIYNEGILGTMTNVNPIYATSAADTSLSRLIFAGLFTYNNQNQLVGCLASGYSVDSTGTVYTVRLKPNLTWQDGKPLTASDVVYTIRTIQNPDAQSPLYNSWQGIVATAPNPQTVTFTLPNPLASFPYSLTVGILPQHILGNIDPANLRSLAFNTSNPVGAGPYAWHQILVGGNTPQNASEQIALVAFRNYALGAPKINEFNVYAVADQQQLINDFQSGQVNALAGLDSVPSSIISDHSVQIHSLILTAGNYVFFNTTDGPLADTNVRRALVYAADPTTIIDRLGYITRPVTEPLLLGQLGYTNKYAEQTNNLSAATQLLNQDGWVLDGTVRYKGNQPLEFDLTATDTPENRMVAGILKQEWTNLGAVTNLIFEPADTFLTTLQDRNYDATLNGISIGNDPDVFVYWDGSQIDPRSFGLNFSEYNNPTANESLEAGRTRLDPALRIIKYQPFLADWQADAPALGLYQPRSIYITRQTVYGLTGHEINSADDRYDGIQNWEIQTAGVTN